MPPGARPHRQPRGHSSRRRRHPPPPIDRAGRKGAASDQLAANSRTVDRADKRVGGAASGIDRQAGLDASAAFRRLQPLLAVPEALAPHEIRRLAADRRAVPPAAGPAADQPELSHDISGEAEPLVARVLDKGRPEPASRLRAVDHESRDVPA